MVSSMFCESQNKKLPSRINGDVNYRDEIPRSDAKAQMGSNDTNEISRSVLLHM